MSDQNTTHSRTDGLPLPEAYQPEANGVLRCYNMFPRNYENFDAMTADLPRIKAMGFSHVWLNPLHETTSVEKKKWPEGTPNGLKGSLYSMRDPHAFNPDFSTVTPEERATLSDAEIFEKDKAALKRFTTKARELGMIPMFDLVLSHLAPDSAITTGTHPDFQNGDTKNWFDRYDNGQPKRHGLDQDGNILPSVQYPDKEVWDDVVMLEYDDPAIRKDIVERLWKPFMELYLDLGFMGVRVDSVANNHPDVMNPVLEHFREQYAQKHGGSEPTILGESLGGTIENQGNINPLATHLYNSAYWLPNTTGPNITADGTDAKTLWGRDNNWFLLEQGLKQTIIFKDRQTGEEIAGRKGGTVGYAGSHDELPWLLHFPKDLPPMPHDQADEELFKAAGVTYPIDAEAAGRAIREKMAVAAMASDGGWFLTSFDERLDTTLRSVFDKQTKGVQLGNLEGFVKDINHILKSMPQTRHGSWSKRFFDDANPDLVIIERHTGYGFSGPGHLVIMNIAPDKSQSLTTTDVQRLANLTGRKPADFFASGAEKSVWLGGGITLPEKSAGFAARVEQSRANADNGPQRRAS